MRESSEKPKFSSTLTRIIEIFVIGFIFGGGSFLIAYRQLKLEENQAGRLPQIKYGIQVDFDNTQRDTEFEQARIDALNTVFRNINEYMLTNPKATYADALENLTPVSVSIKSRPYFILVGLSNSGGSVATNVELVLNSDTPISNFKVFGSKIPISNFYSTPIELNKLSEWASLSSSVTHSLSPNQLALSFERIAAGENLIIQVSLLNPPDNTKSDRLIITSPKKENESDVYSSRFYVNKGQYWSQDLLLVQWSVNPGTPNYEVTITFDEGVPVPQSTLEAVYIDLGPGTNFEP